MQNIVLSGILPITGLLVERERGGDSCLYKFKVSGIDTNPQPDLCFYFQLVVHSSTWNSVCPRPLQVW